MKKNLKAWMLILISALFIHVPALADKDVPISVNQLPAAAQQVLTKHFAGVKVSLAKMESGIIEKSYDVILTNGTRLEFDRNGNWTEISCKGSAVPAALVPTAIAKYVQSNYPGTAILKIERDRRTYEIDLANGVEVTFNKSYQVIDIDM